MSKRPRLSFRPKRPGLRPGRESRNPVTRSGSNSTEAGGYWVPARRKPGHKRVLRASVDALWPGLLGRDDNHMRWPSPPGPLQGRVAPSSCRRNDGIQQGLTRIASSCTWRNAIGRFAPAGTAGRVFRFGRAAFLRSRAQQRIDHRPHLTRARAPPAPPRGPFDSGCAAGALAPSRPFAATAALTVIRPCRRLLGRKRRAAEQRHALE
jgi:hypothetical protein